MRRPGSGSGHHGLRFSTTAVRGPRFRSAGDSCRPPARSFIPMVSCPGCPGRPWKALVQRRHPHLPRLSAPRDRLQRVQRTTGRIDVLSRCTNSPLLPGPCGRHARLRRRGRGLGFRCVERAYAARAGPGHHVPPAHRPAAAVYVEDRYEGFDAKRFADCTDEEIEEYLARNVAAVREVAELARPDVALANHLVMGPVVLARALADVPYTAKIHGSALEYTVKPDMGASAVGARGPRACARDPRGVAAHGREPVGRDGGRQPAAAHRASGRPASTSRSSGRARRRRRRPPCASSRAASPRCRSRPPPRATASRATRRRPPPSRLDPARTGSSRSWASSWPRRAWTSAPRRSRVLAAEPRASSSSWARRVPRRPVPLLARCERDLAGARGARRARSRRVARSARPPARLPRRAGVLRRPRASSRRRAPARALRAHRAPGAPRAGRLLPACEAQVVSSDVSRGVRMVAAEARGLGILPVSAAHSAWPRSPALARRCPEQAPPWLRLRGGRGAVRDLAASLSTGCSCAGGRAQRQPAPGLVEVVAGKCRGKGSRGPSSRRPRRAFRAGAGHVGSGAWPRSLRLPRRRHPDGEARPAAARPVRGARFPVLSAGPTPRAPTLYVEFHDRRDVDAGALDVGRVPGTARPRRSRRTSTASRSGRSSTRWEGVSLDVLLDGVATEAALRRPRSATAATPRTCRSTT